MAKRKAITLLPETMVEYNKQVNEALLNIFGQHLDKIEVVPQWKKRSIIFKVRRQKKLKN